MRRLVPVLLVALALVAVACRPSYPQPRGDLARSGHQPEAEAVTEATVAGLTPLWSTPVGGLGTAPLVPAPVVAGGTVVVPTRDAVLAFAADGSGCDPVSGACAPIWTGELPFDETLFTALISGGLVLVTAGGFDSGGVVIYSLAPGDHCSGSPPTCPPLAVIPGHHFLTPAIADERLYVPTFTDGSSEEAIEGYDLLDCVDGDGCAPVWRAVGPGGAPLHWMRAAPTIVGDRLHAVADLPMTWDLTGVEGCSGTAPVVCEPIAVVDPGRTPFLEYLMGGSLPVEAGVGAAVSLDDAATSRLELFDVAGGAGCVGAPTATCPVLGAAEVADVAFPNVAVVDGVAYVPGEDDGELVVQGIDVAACASVPAPCPIDTWWSGPPASPWLLSTTVAGEALFAASEDGPVAFARSPEGCGSAASPCPPLWEAGVAAPYWSEVVVVGDLVLAVGGPTSSADVVEGTLHVWQLPG